MENIKLQNSTSIGGTGQTDSHTPDGGNTDLYKSCEGEFGKLIKKHIVIPILGVHLKIHLQQH